jgi:hypothetical protein
MKLGFNLHRVFARLHGGARDETPITRAISPMRSDDFKSAYADYASATAEANVLLQKHGPQSPQFASADVVSMRLFHRVKKMQGLKKPRSG